MLIPFTCIPTPREHRWQWIWNIHHLLQLMCVAPARCDKTHPGEQNSDGCGCVFEYFSIEGPRIHLNG